MILCDAGFFYAGKENNPYMGGNSFKMFLPPWSERKEIALRGAISSSNEESLFEGIWCSEKQTRSHRRLGLKQKQSHKRDLIFLLKGFSDCVRCYFCGGGLRNWEDGDIPWSEHARWYPNCDYLKRQKGDLFIQMHRQDQNQEPAYAPLPPPPPSPPSPRERRHDVTRETEKRKEEDDIAFRSVLEMGYPESKVNSVIEQLRKRGKSKYSATDILQIILDEEEKRAAAASASTNGSLAPPQTTATLSTKPSMPSAESQSLLKENQNLKEQMICKICLDKDACMVFLPCGHIVTCQDCAKTIRKCCICRKLIQGTVKAYL